MTLFKHPLKLLVAAGAIATLSACAGTGTRDHMVINNEIQNATPNTVFVSRSTGFSGSAVRIAIEVDGVVVAQLSNNQVTSFELPAGEHFIKATFGGLAGATTESASLRYVEDLTQPQFLNVSLRTNFLTSELILSEVSARSFAGTVR